MAVRAVLVVLMPCVHVSAALFVLCSDVEESLVLLAAACGWALLNGDDTPTGEAAAVELFLQNSVVT